MADTAAAPQQGSMKLTIHGSNFAEENGHLALAIGSMPFKITSISRGTDSGNVPVWIISFEYTPAS